MLRELEISELYFVAGGESPDLVCFGSIGAAGFSAAATVTDPTVITAGLTISAAVIAVGSCSTAMIGAAVSPSAATQQALLDSIVASDPTGLSQLNLEYERAQAADVAAVNAAQESNMSNGFENSVM